MNHNGHHGLTKIYVLGALLLFLGVELLVVTVLRKHWFNSSHDVVANIMIYGIWFFTLSPALVGLQGLFLIKDMHWRSDVTERAKQKLYSQFVFGICIAYGALGFIIIMFQKLGQ